MKKWLTCILVLICCLLTGCSTVTSSVKVHIQDGTLIVEQSLAVDFDKEALAAGGYDYETTLNSLMSTTSEYMEAFHYEYNARKEDYLTNPKKQKYFRLFSSGYNEDIVVTDSGFYVYRQFPTIYDFLLYNDYDILYIGCPHCKAKIAETETDAKLITTCANCNLAINTTDDSGERIEYEYFPASRIVDFPFTGEVTTTEQDFWTNYSAEVLTVYKDIASLVNKNNEPLIGKLEYMFSKGLVSYSLEDVELKFEFITPYGRVHSNGDVHREGLYYVHTWNIENPDTSIILYRTTANRTMWYVVALLVTFGVTMVILIFALVKRKRYEKSKQKKDAHNNLIDIIR